MREDAFHPPAPPGTRGTSAWFDVGRADGRAGRRDRNPVWAGADVRKAWLDGFYTAAAGREPSEAVAAPLVLKAPPAPREGPVQGELGL